jgi:hypothetical protein
MDDMIPPRISINRLAGIQYHGMDGVTAHCLSALASLVVRDIPVKSAFLITFNRDHAFLLQDGSDEVIAVKAGFSSGYTGEGPRGLANALALLDRHYVDIEEYRVEQAFMERLASSCLLQSDVDTVIKGKPVRPRTWYSYIYDQYPNTDFRNRPLSSLYRHEVPFRLIDERILDLAVNFRNNADAALLSAYRRLEDILRERTGLLGEGVRLFSKAFIVDGAPLCWDVPDEGESKGRANLFVACYMAFRNARVHREQESNDEALLREFLLVNELYRLEAEALTAFELEKKKAAEDEEQRAMEALTKNVN